jgi:hypothetical protein
MLRRAVAGQSRRIDSEVLPAITLDVEPTHAGLQAMSAQLGEFARDHDLPAQVGSRIVSVASDVAGAVAEALAGPPVGRLQADADIGLADAQLVLIAADHRLPAVYRSLRPQLDAVAARCDAFVAELSPGSELQVWACFQLARDDAA